MAQRLVLTRQTSAYDAGGAVGLVVLLAVLITPGVSQEVRAWASSASFVLIPAVAAWRCERAARRGGPWAPSWRLFAVALLVWAVGSAWWGGVELLGVAAPSFPSPADLGWLAFPVLAIAGLLRLPGMPRRAAPAARLLLDGVASAAALLLLARFGPLADLQAHGRPWAVHAAAIAYPSIDVLAGAVVLLVLDRLVGGSGNPGVLAAVGLAGVCGMDLLYALLSLAGHYEPGTVLDAGWSGAFLLIGFAADRPPPPAAPARAAERHLLPTLPALVALVALLASGRLASGLDPVLLGDVVVLGASLAARQHLLAAENRALHRSLEARVAERTAELRAAREVFRRRAYTDPLTGLGNRDAFSDAVAAAANDRPGRFVGVVLIDLDGFKQVNDGFGHETGDQVLVAVAGRLRRCADGLSVAAQVARLGGDEFACVLRGLVEPEGADLAASRLLAALRTSVTVHGREFFVGASAGVAVAPSPLRRTASDLLREADTAMYVAKETGGQRARTFDSGMHHRVVESVALEADLHRALDEGEIQVHYQPVCALPGREVVGVEALARWHHPERGWVSPEQFVPVAERTGLVVELDRQVFEQACRQAARWSEDAPDLHIAVNFSARHVLEPGMADEVLAGLQRHGLAPRRLVMEVTESLLFADEDAAGEVLAALHEAGVVLALDDFGTGFSSLSRLSDHPFDILKVDRSFLAAVGEGTPPPILLATLAMARGLGLDVVAEGVETERQLEVLLAHGCGFVQGYLLGRPVPAAEVDLRLSRSVVPAPR